MSQGGQCDTAPGDPGTQDGGGPAATAPPQRPPRVAVRPAAGSGRAMAHVRAAMHTTGGTKRSRTRRKAFNDEMKDMLKELTGQENLLLNGSDLFLVLDASGVVTYCSASVPSILFHAVEEIENQFLALYARPSSRAVLATVLHQAQHTAATQPLHLRLWRPDGALVHLEGVVGRRSLSPICTTDHPTARSVASKLAQMPPPTGGVPSGGPPPDGDYELPLVLWVAHETPAFPQAEATLQAAEQRLQQEDAQEAAWVPPGVVNSAGQSPAGALEGNDRNDPGAGDENGSNGATVPQGPTKEEQNGASAERQPQAVAPFHGVAPFAGNQLNTAAFFGSPHPRGWGEDNLAADLPLARVQGDFGEVKTALAALAAATGPPSSHTVFLEVDTETLVICRAWGDTKVILGVRPAALARQRLESVLCDADLRALVRKVIDPASQGGTSTPVAVSHRTAHGSQEVLVTACTRPAGVHPDAALHPERVVLAERKVVGSEKPGGSRQAVPDRGAAADQQ